MSEKREPGYYWVRIFTGWITAEYYGNLWYLVGDEEGYRDADLLEIGHCITPEMKYTEKDMKNFAEFTRYVSDDLNDWLKQRKEK